MILEHFDIIEVTYTSQGTTYSKLFQVAKDSGLSESCDKAKQAVIAAFPDVSGCIAVRRAVYTLDVDLTPET